jgi:heavy metal sensor kinase
MRASRLPIRLRLTAAFAAVMTVVLAATGMFLYVRMGHELDRTIDQGLRSRAGDVSALVKQADSGLASAGRSPLTEQGENLAQIVDSRGAVVDAPPPLRNHSLLTSAELARARSSTIVVDHEEGPRGGDPIRLLATPVRAQDRKLIAVVGASLEDRHDALASLGALLLLGGPAALLLASLAGYGTAAAALRPVEAMRRRASEIQAAEPGQRLPVPPTDDEVARLGATLNAMIDRLEVALARERTFVSDASHELRTPLAILKTELELAMRGSRTTEELEAALRSAADETDRLAQLAEDLLVIARSDHGKLPIRQVDVAVADVVGGVTERFARRVADHGGSLGTNVPEGLRIQADPLRLEQALGNLIDNALRHGGRTIEIRVERNGDTVELHVGDDGPGFPPDFLPMAFERFSRADAARGRGGAGLGLTIVATIAKAHGGHAEARNGPSGGADVWVAIPA